MNMETGEVLEDLEEIMDYILSYNTDNMSKIEASYEVKEIQDIKKEALEEMFQDTCQFPQCNAREILENAWIARRMQLDQCLELRLIYRDSEQAET